MNKTIYILWFQGFDSAPELVKKCVQSWKHYNSDWNIVMLDRKTLVNYVKLEDYVDLTKKKLPKPALSDVVRISLLNKYGGLWVDATTFCNKPLNDWLPNYIKTGFFAFNKPAPGRLVSTWFMYSEKEHYITHTWLKSVVEYYTINDTPHDYYWVHYLFGKLHRNDEKFKELWKIVPKLSPLGLGPDYIQTRGMFKPMTEDVKKNIDIKITPLYKLTYKCNFKKYDETLNLYYLYSTLDTGLLNKI